ncbi:TRAP transporter large permease subunit [Desulfovibrio sp. Huiquan2017]|uniref:GntP family permease n=1 Tax=Desulfovibrio sp. Huiquan2017 TaxID=2816861 RepID=UPI001A932FB8|nr:TRAP transporter large permease subunit [Desulfovibrio sp. Huiquan2017]
MLVFAFVLTIVLLIFLIVKVRVHAFIVLLFSGLLFGLLAGNAPVEVAKNVAAGFGGTLQHIGIVIVLGVLVGEILERTGGAQKIARSILKVVGIKRATYATSITGAMVAIPVFCDSGFVILNPIIKAISRVGKIPYMTLVVALMAALLTTHSFIPPTPGPVAAAALFNADLGRVMLYGLIISIPVVIACSIWANSRFIKGAYPELAEEEEIEDAARKIDESLESGPSTFMSYLPILIPIVLIVTSSFVHSDSAFGKVIGFVGTPWVALFIGTLAAFMLPKKCDRTVTEDWVVASMKSASEILLITGAAGGFAKVLQSTDIGMLLCNFILDTGLPGFVIPYLMATLMDVAMGSATVALMTVGAILGPIVGTLGITPEVAVLATAAGSLTFCHTNSSYFWCVSKMAGITELRTSYRIVTATSVIMGIVAMISLYILKMFI